MKEKLWGPLMRIMLEKGPVTDVCLCCFRNSTRAKEGCKGSERQGMWKDIEKSVASVVVQSSCQCDENHCSICPEVMMVFLHHRLYNKTKLQRVYKLKRKEYKNEGRV